VTIGKRFGCDLGVANYTFDMICVKCDARRHNLLIFKGSPTLPPKQKKENKRRK
jgi:hypothetical protein